MTTLRDSGLPELGPGPNCDGILLWEQESGPVIPAGRGILAGQEQRALLRAGGQEWGSDQSVHTEVTASGLVTDGGVPGQVYQGGVQGRVVPGRVPGSLESGQNRQNRQNHQNRQKWQKCRFAQK